MTAVSRVRVSRWGAGERPGPPCPGLAVAIRRLDPWTLVVRRRTATHRIASVSLIGSRGLTAVALM